VQLVEDEVAVLEHLTVVLPALVATTSTVSPEPTPWVSIVGVVSDVFASPCVPESLEAANAIELGGDGST
jgi:hypothetical protein